MLTREFLKQFDMINDTINKRVTLVVFISKSSLRFAILVVQNETHKLQLLQHISQEESKYKEMEAIRL